MDAFRKLPDPRQSPARKASLWRNPLPFIALAATISGMDGLEDIAVFSREREDWLRSRL
ncbi:transposase family protein [Akkermansiaceae bacterium]|nr:transposase family protein [Akkermansiaceae bacterium]